MNNSAQGIELSISGVDLGHIRKVYIDIFGHYGNH